MRGRGGDRWSAAGDPAEVELTRTIDQGGPPRSGRSREEIAVLGKLPPRIDSCRKNFTPHSYETSSDPASIIPYLQTSGKR
jgi:hypothetical protein